MSIKAELELKSALLSTSLVQPVDSKSRGKVLEVLCRQMPGQEKPWLGIVQDMLERAQKDNFDLHICRRYVLKEGQLAFGWNIGIETENAGKLMAAVEALKEILAESKPVLSAVPMEHKFQSVPVPLPKPQLGHKIIAKKKGPLVAKGKASRDRILPIPRPPGEPGYADDPPSGFIPQITTIRESVDPETGKPIKITEMPLPHIYRELNRPAHKDGKGARLIGESRK